MTGTRVLIVENDKSLARKMEALFRENLMDTKTVGSAMAAIVCMTRDCPQILVIDCDLPDRDGIDTCSILRALRCRFDCVLLTSEPSERVMQAARQNGICQILVKPFEFSELRDALGLGRAAHFGLSAMAA